MNTTYSTADCLGQNLHGFFGRGGGGSTGIYASLNCGQGSGDDQNIVGNNRMLVAQNMNLAADNLLSLHQIHSATVVVIDKPIWPDSRPKADAMVTALTDIGLGIITADCAPILFCDPVQNIIGAAHAGWKGAKNGVIAATVETMINLGAKRENISAAVGPCISQQAYEVGQEFLETFLDEDPNFSQFFINGLDGKYQFDLAGFALSMLHEQKLQAAQWVKKCTYTNDSEYFSYRRTTHNREPDYGRQISVITNQRRVVR